MAENWTWDNAGPCDRADWVRLHMPFCHYSMFDLCNLFHLTWEGATAILNGDDWRQSHERQQSRYNPRNAGKRKVVCKRGHPYTEENTIWRLNEGRRTRRCRECERLRKQELRSRRVTRG